MYKLFGLITLQSMLLVLTQSFAKIALKAFGPFEWTWHFMKVVFTTWQFAVFGLFGVASMGLYAYILNNYDFSLAYPLTSISYVFSLIAALLIFQETIPWTRWLGVIIIMVGVFFVLK
mgnify:CR=1 FL=1